MLNKNGQEEIKVLPDILRFSLKHYPRRTAIIFGRKQISYEEIYENALTTCQTLKEVGVKKEDRVALLLDNCPDFVFCYFGILMAGGIVVPINHMFKRDEIRYILQDSESSCMITSSTYREIARELLVMTGPLKRIVYTNQDPEDGLSLRARKTNEETLVNGFESEREALSENDTAVFLYTSGTTGHPKAAMLTHKNLLCNMSSSSKAIEVTSRDTVICFLPLFHSFAATVCMLMPLSKGGKTAIMKSPRPIKKLLRTIRKNRVTIFVGIPSMYNIIKDLRLPKFLSPLLLRLFNPLRLAISGAAALPVEVFNKFERKFNMPLLEGYGLTEASPVVSLNPLKGRRKAGSIGLPLPDVEVKIVDEHENTLPPEEVGELCVKGPNVMQGYYKKEDANKETLKDNWLFTGDMAKKDSGGYIYIMGRKKDMVNVRGLNVYPREIEEVLYQNPNIKEAAVIGIPDAHKGEVPKGFVVLKAKDSMTEHEIVSYLKERLALYKVPKRIEIRDALPKNTSGKILKRLLKEEGNS